jgi:hypothetical protein
MRYACDPGLRLTCRLSFLLPLKNRLARTASAYVASLGELKSIKAKL